jgi:hypothetical protein
LAVVSFGQTANSYPELEMLISHQKKFIFTKTIKTASTSVEFLFEPFCLNEETNQLLHSGEEIICSSGVVGARGKSAKAAIWYNHMPLKKIEELMDASQFSEYFKFTTIRNPFDKMVSLFKYLERRKNKLKRNNPAASVPDFNINDDIKDEISRFRDWLKNDGLVLDRGKYFMDENPAIDFFIKFENLQKDLLKVCKQLEISPEILNQLPYKKRGGKNNQITTKSYFDVECQTLVENLYHWELNAFNYEL